MKQCSRCKLNKPFSAFHKNAKKHDLLRSDCKDCRNKYRREFRQKNKEQFLKYENTKEFKDKQFKQILKREYGLTIEEFNSMLSNQKGLCKLCGKAERHRTKKKLSIDHCHITGKVRGLLCHRCNVFLGLIGEDVAVLNNAIEYLARK